MGVGLYTGRLIREYIRYAGALNVEVHYRNVRWNLVFCTMLLFFVDVVRKPVGNGEDEGGNWEEEDCIAA